MVAETIGDRIRLRRELLRLSQGKLAEGVGVSQPTVWEWETGKSVPTRARVKTIAKALRTTADYLERGDARAEQHYEGLPLRVPIIGTVQAGAWMEAYQLPEGEWKYMSLPADERYPGVERLGFRNVGASMNRRFADGAILVCVLYRQIQEEPQDGHYVIVEREDTGGRVEATCKLLKADGSGKLWLWPESNDPLYQAPIKLEGDRNIAEIRVIARVLRVVSDV
jgi:DNA-binding XRE family transcriptional regulator